MNTFYFASGESQIHPNPETLETARSWKFTDLSGVGCKALTSRNKKHKIRGL